MTVGGPRNRGGRPIDPSSARSQERGTSGGVYRLPLDPYPGPVPAFPLPKPSRRELTVWAEAWTWPQAWAWSLPGQQFRVRTVAQWVRLTVACEDPGCGAALHGQVHRYADQAGLTTAGLRELGWVLNIAEVADVPTVAATRSSSRSRFKVLPPDAAAAG